MSRRRKAQKRPVLPDSKYDSPLVSLLINVIMKDGKKTVAQRIVYEAFGHLNEQLGEVDPVDVLLGARENGRPKFEVKNQRVGGTTLPVPRAITFARQERLFISWLVKASRSMKGVSMDRALAKLIIDTHNNVGPVIENKDNIHKMAHANRAWAHLR